MTTEKTVQQEADEKPKATRTRKKVNLDAELAKQRGTFAVGIQATIRDLMKLKK